MAKSNKGKVVTTTRTTKVSRTADADVAPVVVERGGMSWQDGVAIVTTIALIAAILVADKGMAGYGAGKFF